MTREDIIKLANKAGFPEWWTGPFNQKRDRGIALDALTRFTDLVEAADRELIQKLKDALKECVEDSRCVLHNMEDIECIEWRGGHEACKKQKQQIERAESALAAAGASHE